MFLDELKEYPNLILQFENDHPVRFKSEMKFGQSQVCLLV